MSLEAALERICQQTSQRLEPWLRRQPHRTSQFRLAEAARSRSHFLCDAGLGGLARWLRAAGYEAHWQPHIEDDELLDQARRLDAIVLTTDSLLMERRLLRDGIIPALWLPPTLSLAEQVTQVMHQLRLEPRPPRCMACGGSLKRGDKEALRDRIPPRTYKWLDEFFVCERCDKLFWHGTHWNRIQQRLAALK